MLQLCQCWARCKTRGAQGAWSFAGEPAAQREGAWQLTGISDAALLAALAARASVLAASGATGAALDALLGWALHGAPPAAAAGPPPSGPPPGLPQEAVHLGAALLCAYRCGAAPLAEGA